jgi:acetyl-CoA acetyltransferase
MTAMTFFTATSRRHAEPLRRARAVAQRGCSKDMDVVQIYDAFTPQIPIAFEEFGFCREGEAPAYMAEGKNPPYNTSGGGLSEAYVHGFNLLVEGVRQIRGTSTTQIADVRHTMVTGGNVIPTGAVVFSKEAW